MSRRDPLRDRIDQAERELERLLAMVDRPDGPSPGILDECIAEKRHQIAELEQAMRESGSLALL